MDESNSLNILDKIAFMFKFNLIVAVTILSILGAGVVQDKLHWGAAQAEEVKQAPKPHETKFGQKLAAEIDSNEVVMPPIPFGGY